MNSDNIMIIGVAGGTGSGKTTLARHIANAFGDRVAVITHDSYYRAQNDKSIEERALQNYVEDEISQLLLDGALQPGDRITVTVTDEKNKLNFEAERQ